MSTRTKLLIVATLALALIVPGPPAARAGANLGPIQLPGILGVADKGVLTILTNPQFTGCTSWDPYSPFPIAGQPGVERWAFITAYEGGEPVPPVNIKLTVTPKGAVNGYWHETLKARVYRYQGPGLVASFMGNPCEFYASTPYLAEGPVEMLYESADDGLAGPGVNSWGLNVRGTLDDVTGECSSGAVEYRLLRRWIQYSPGPEYIIDKVTASKGPSLTCAR